MRGVLAFGVCGVLLVGGAARADHTGEDARRTTRRLEAILREAEAPKHKEEAPKHKAKTASAAPAKTASATPAKAASATPAKAAGATPASASASATTTKMDAPAKRATVVKARHDEGDAIADEMGKVVEHSVRIAFDPKEQAAHLKDIPKTPAEVEAHLRRLNRALDDAHRR